jgi:hypothetical protein
MLLIASGLASAQPATKPTASITITALPSTAVLNLTPLSPGSSGNANLWKYVGVTNLTSFYESFPVRVCVAGTDGVTNRGVVETPWPVSVAVNSSGGNLPGTTQPTYASFTQDGCQTENIIVDVNSLTPDNYNRNFNFAATAENQANKPMTGDLVQIHVTVTQAPSTTCFITDSSFNFLLNCDLQPVTEGALGRFAIVTNKKGTQVATNPGQFYYNMLWTNTTGSQQTVSVNMTPTGVTAHGAQAIHAALFATDPTIDASTFAAVNDAIPSGADNAVESVVVPNGYTLWVTYHLQWGSLGSLFPSTGALSCSTAGAGGLSFSVAATITSGSQTLGACGAGASGFKK